MAETKWTPGKLEVASNEVELLDEKGHLIARVTGYLSDLPREANAARIVQCWNNHDALCEVLEQLVGFCALAEAFQVPGRPEWDNTPQGPLATARRVLAAARGEQVGKGEK